MSHLTVSLAALYGLCFGSFANVVIYRLPRGESILPASRCPACGRRLALTDLIPVLSFIVLRRRCRTCKAPIAWRYPATEAATAALFAAMAVYAGPTVSLLPLCMLAFTLLCVAAIDAKTQEIPDSLLIYGAAWGAAWVAAGYFWPAFAPGAPHWRDALLGILAAALPLLAIDRLALLLLKKDGFGYGDVKLCAVMGLYLGWRLSFVMLYAAVVLGAAFGVWLIATGRGKRGAYMAFGPFLCAGCVAALWWGGGMLARLF